MPLLLLLLACSSDPEPDVGVGPPPLDAALIAQLDPLRMRAHTDVLADDATGGRVSGSPGSELARDYLRGEMLEIGLEPMGLNADFDYAYASEPDDRRFMLDASGQVVPHDGTNGINLIGAIPGSDPELAHEVMVVMAHYDHLGVTQDGDPYNGAFDNAAAVAMHLEIARVLIEQGVQFDRTLVFLFTDEEETNLRGADEWIRDPTVPQEDVVFGVSTDPLGRPMLPDFAPIALIGLERTPGLEAVWRQAARHVDDVFFVNQDVILPVFASDHDRFFDQDTPAAWFANMGMTWYHTADDHPETIDYRLMLRNAELLMYALAIAGRSDERYTYEGPVEPAGDAARDVRKLFEGVLRSSYPSDAERAEANAFIAELDQIIEADSADDVGALYATGLFFLLFDLPGKYPGDVPPPLPG